MNGKIFCIGVMSLLSFAALAVNNSSNVTVANGRIRATPSEKIVLDEKFSNNWFSMWNPIINYNDRLSIRCQSFLGKPALLITKSENSSRDTAFELSTIPLKTGIFSSYRIEFEVASNMVTSGFYGFKNQYHNKIVFYDKDKNRIGEEYFRYTAARDKYKKNILSGTCPQETEYISLHFGANTPDVLEKEYIAYANVKIYILPASGKADADAGFTSRIFPVPGKADVNLSWELSDNDASAKFQIAKAPDCNGFPGKFSEFAGPDGTPSTWYTVNPSKIENLKKNDRWLRYKVRLSSSGDKPAELVKVTLAGHCDCDWKEAFDHTAPVVSLGSASPMSKGTSTVEIKIMDPSGIDWSSLEVLLDNQKITNGLQMIPDGIAMVSPTVFSEGLHKIDLKINDFSGNAAKKKLFFVIGKKASGGVVSLRKDGMLLIDGKPFFPIGVTSVTKREFNQYNYDNAFRVLKEAGFNMAHTWKVKRNAEFREFMNAAQRYGFKLRIPSVGSANDDNLESIAASLYADRLHPSLLAWYVGDDTAILNSPEQVRERTELVKSIAPHLITVQADHVNAEQKISRYEPFVDSTLAFMPEIYPVTKDTPDIAESCVAQVICDMKRCYSDLKKKNASARSFWPLIQYFKGWRRWKRFPTRNELRAMSYAALIHGAHGIFWYTYGGSGENAGVTSSPERWKNITELSKEISYLSPILTEYNAEQQIPVKIVKGPVEDACGGASVTAMTKIHDGKLYLFCVNSTMQNVCAEFTVSDYQKYQIVFSDETGTVKNNTVRHEFKPYEVRIYEFSK